MHFDRTLSYRLDRVIIALDANPPRWRRILLRIAKRYLERGVPCSK